MDLALDPQTGDLLLESGRLRLATGLDAIAQDVTMRLRFFLGEWFLDTRIGVPYFQEILVKNPNIPRVTQLLRQVVQETPGVTSVDRFDFTLDAQARNASVAFTASTTAGQLTYDRELILGVEQ